jgi:hypothetical protein
MTRRLREQGRGVLAPPPKPRLRRRGYGVTRRAEPLPGSWLGSGRSGWALTAAGREPDTLRPPTYFVVAHGLAVVRACSQQSPFALQAPAVARRARRPAPTRTPGRGARSGAPGAARLHGPRAQRAHPPRRDRSDRLRWTQARVRRGEDAPRPPRSVHAAPQPRPAGGAAATPADPATSSRARLAELGALPDRLREAQRRDDPLRRGGRRTRRTRPAAAPRPPRGGLVTRGAPSPPMPLRARAAGRRATERTCGAGARRPDGGSPRGARVWSSRRDRQNAIPGAACRRGACNDRG